MSPMPEALRSFNENGISAFTGWLAHGAVGAVPRDLLFDDAFSKDVGVADLRSEERFADRYEFGCRLVQLLQHCDSRSISYDRGLWTWLAAWFFEQLCPVDENGVRAVRNSHAYILDSSRRYYRHLVRTTWSLVNRHGVACRYLLVSFPNDRAPLSRHSDLLDALAARQFMIASPTLIATASRLYVNKRTGRPRRGVGRGRGSPRRLALIANQLALTYDIRDMPVENFMRLLPEEFSASW